MRKITHIVVHHTASARDGTTFAAVNQYHRTKNWGTAASPIYAKKSSLGYYCQYHWFIEASGKITQCRTDEEIGWHATEANPYSIGICLAGWFDQGHDQTPTEAQIQSLAGLLRQYTAKYSIPLTNIVPHRAYSTKSCYGYNLAESWARDLIKQPLMTKTRMLALYNEGADTVKIKDSLDFAKAWFEKWSVGAVIFDYELVDASDEKFQGIFAVEPNGHQITIVDPVQISSYGYHYEFAHGKNYDTVCLFYNSDTIINHRPTNPAHNPSMFAGFTTLQIAADSVTVPEIMHEFFVHEVLHGFSTLIRERRHIDFPDTVHNYSGLSDPRPEANFSHLFSVVMKPYWTSLQEIAGGPVPVPPTNSYKPNAMIILKKVNDPMLYVPCGTTLIPFVTDFETYKKDFASASIVELSDVEFAKLKIATAVKITNK